MTSNIFSEPYRKLHNIKVVTGRPLSFSSKRKVNQKCIYSCTTEFSKGKTIVNKGLIVPLQFKVKCNAALLFIFTVLQLGHNGTTKVFLSFLSKLPLI